MVKIDVYFDPNTGKYVLTHGDKTLELDEQEYKNLRDHNIKGFLSGKA